MLRTANTSLTSNHRLDFRKQKKHCSELENQKKTVYDQYGIFCFNYGLYLQDYQKFFEAIEDGKPEAFFKL